jgi:hypothetical protein
VRTAAVRPPTRRSPARRRTTSTSSESTTPQPTHEPQWVPAEPGDETST